MAERPMDRAAHWDAVFRKKAPDDVSWYAPHLELSIAMIRAVAGPSAGIIDVGAGASTLVDDLLDLGYAHVTALDVSAAALDVVRKRLGPRAADVTWITADILKAGLPSARYDVWHDRAVFHFLTGEDEREDYVRIAASSVRAGGCLIVAAFAPDGPSRCSGLDVARHDGPSLARDLGPAFALEEEAREIHRTPWGDEQRFVYCRFCKTDAKAP